MAQEAHEGPATIKRRGETLERTVAIVPAAATVPLLQYASPLYSVAIPLPLGGALPLLPAKKKEEG